MTVKFRDNLCFNIRVPTQIVIAPELRTLIKETMLETLRALRLGEIDRDEQNELESMFGSTPIKEEYVHEREIDL